MNGIDEEDEGGGKGLPILLVVVVIGVIIYMFNYRSSNEYIEECKPDHYASHEVLAHGLVKVKCLDRHGRSRSILIETDKD
ncbi:hypothetical protein LCGC14_0547220 [marine sediment metagenome]|uniref:Uncharacterized protein n=1 Tax=marine sediment metagenome TaxID=412755 RepID=A0A0F9RR17_9ZZZZ